jgi:D-glycero-alpha-D-manno-heptose-7-phosphate kinase
MHNVAHKVFCSKAPVRVDFTGGYTDIAPFTNHFTGKAVNAAIKLFTYVDGFLRDDKKICIFSEDICTRIEAGSLNKLNMDGQLDIVKAILFEFSIPDGVEIRIKSEAPLGSGLGTSASLGVATAGLINALTNSRRNRLEIAELAAYAERKVGIAGGRQDQYASAMGGIHLLEFSGNNSNILKIDLQKEQIKLLEKHLLLIHPHGTRNSGYNGLGISDQKLMTFKGKLQINRTFKI